jgi:NADH-quinone oxidoreductase subunit A
MQNEVSEFGGILLYLIGGAAFFVVAMTASWVLRPKRPNVEKNAVYESGEEAVSSPHAQFNIRFYVIALIFVLFDIELAFLFPWAVVFANPSLQAATNGLWGWLALAEAFIFVLLLSLGLLYAWKKGFLSWDKPSPPKATSQSKVPKQLYEDFNKKYGVAISQD